MQLGALLGLGRLAVYRRLRVLRGYGLVAYERPFERDAGVFLITASGLSVLGSELPAPRLDLRVYRHDLLAASVSIELAAEHPDLTVVSEREMRSRDRRADCADHRADLGVAYPGLGPAGHPRRHYPDLALLDTDGRRPIAVEVELTGKTRRRLELILTAYARDRHIEQVVYVTDRDVIAGAVARAATRSGAAELLEIRRLGTGIWRRTTSACTQGRRDAPSGRSATRR